MSSTPAPIGSVHLVLKGGVPRRCTILQASIDPTSLARTVYVSFAPELDKRLDEWIDESRLLGPAPAWETSIASTAERATAAKTVEPVGVDGVATSASSEQQQKQAAVAIEGTPSKPDSVLKTKTQLRHEKERRSLESELTGSRKRKLPGDATEQPVIKSTVSDPEAEHKLLTRVKNFTSVRYGPYEIQPWYHSPYPMEETHDKQHQQQQGGLTATGGSSVASMTTTTTSTKRRASGIHSGAAPASSSSTKIPGVTVPSGGGDQIRAHGGAGGSAEEAAGLRKLFVCDGCFKYTREFASYDMHHRSCSFSSPPGRRVYSKDSLDIWEVDGAAENSRLYCQNLSLFGKLFLDQKTIFYSVETFMFYVCTVRGTKRDEVVGFFSKEKISYDDYNLACIITFPPYQKRSYGRLLIEFSYRLTHHDPTPGTPERPLSDLGLKGYLSFWTSVVVAALKERMDKLDPPPPPLPPPASPFRPAKAAKAKATATTTTTTAAATPVVLGEEKELGVEGRRASMRAKATKEHAVSVLAPAAIPPPPPPPVSPPQRSKPRAPTSLTLTLTDLAQAAHLRIDDVALTLQECGLLRHRLPNAASSSSSHRAPTSTNVKAGTVAGSNGGVKIEREGAEVLETLEDAREETRMVVDAEASHGAGEEDDDEVENGGERIVVTREMLNQLALEKGVRPPILSPLHVLLPPYSRSDRS